jgi:predicted O-methyltransferase YrrM
MSSETLQLTKALRDYMLAASLHEPALFRELREETTRLPEANMQIAPEQGQFMGLLVKLMGVHRALEIGVFTGYSALSVALHLPADGQLVACDVSEEWTTIARRYFARAGVTEKIDLHIAPALDTLGQLLDAGRSGSFDFAFIDADKENYIAYYEACLRLLRPGGLIVVDNVLWDGKVADPAQNDNTTRALRAFNAHVHADDRINLSMLPLADGLTLALKR